MDHFGAKEQSNNKQQTTSKQQAANKKQQTTNNKQQTNKQQTTKNKEETKKTTNDKQQTPNSKQQTNKRIKKQVNVVRSLLFFSPFWDQFGSKAANDQVLALAGHAPLGLHFVVSTCEIQMCRRKATLSAQAYILFMST